MHDNMQPWTATVDSLYIALKFLYGIAFEPFQLIIFHTPPLINLISPSSVQKLAAVQANTCFVSHLSHFGKEQTQSK